MIAQPGAQADYRGVACYEPENAARQPVSSAFGRAMKSGVLFGLLALSTTPSFACRSPLVPDFEGIAKYEAIFIGEIVGIRLVGHIEASRRWGSGNYLSDVTPDYEAEILASTTYVGSVGQLSTVVLGGCSVRELQPRQTALIFVLPNGRAVAVASDETRAYADALSQVQHCASRECK